MWFIPMVNMWLGCLCIFRREGGWRGSGGEEVSISSDDVVAARPICRYREIRLGCQLADLMVGVVNIGWFLEALFRTLAAASRNASDRRMLNRIPEEGHQRDSENDWRRMCAVVNFALAYFGISYVFLYSTGRERKGGGARWRLKFRLCSKSWAKLFRLKAIEKKIPLLVIPLASLLILFI